MRAAWVLFAFFILLGLAWIGLPARASHEALENLEAGIGAPAQNIQTLRTEGPAASDVLRSGLQSPEPRLRLVCARELALLGDPDGDTALLMLMQDRSSLEAQTVASAAETYVIDAWMDRAAPPADERRKAMRFENDGTLQSRLDSIDAALEVYPTWAAGYVFRARLLLAADRAGEAR